MNEQELGPFDPNKPITSEARWGITVINPEHALKMHVVTPPWYVRLWYGLKDFVIYTALIFGMALCFTVFLWSVRGL